MQIVTISNRPRIALETLEFVAALMPFVDEVIFVCPRRQTEAFTPTGGRLAVKVIPEEDLLGDQLQRFQASPDHQLMNWLLRSSLPSVESLQEVFLMADDDSRPLVEIPVEMFVEDGRFHGYTTYALAHWTARTTDYDLGQHRTREILDRRGFPTLSYSAHMPQIIDKALLAEVVTELASETEAGLAIDEWSAYFNIAQTRHPKRFHPPRTYQTLCWPALPTDWDAGVRPATFRFENTYPPLYGEGALFEGLSTRFDANHQAPDSTEKIHRRMAVQSVYDSFVARLLRRAAWVVRRGVQTGEARLTHTPALYRALRRFTPPPIRRFLHEASCHGHDPAWSFPSFMTRYRCRRAGD